MVSIEEIIRKGQKPEKISEDFYEARLLRIISPYFTKFFIDMRISANIVTIISMVVVLSASFMFLYYDRFMFLSWFLYVFVYNLLDDVDGEIARTTESKSSLGNKLETATHVLLTGSFLVFTSIGIYVKLQNIIFIIAVFFHMAFSWILYRQVLEIEIALNITKQELEDLREINRKKHPLFSGLWNKYQKIKSYFEIDRAGFLLILLFQAWSQKNPRLILLDPLFVYYIFKSLDLSAEVIVNKVRLSNARTHFP